MDHGTVVFIRTRALAGTAGLHLGSPRGEVHQQRASARPCGEEICAPPQGGYIGCLCGLGSPAQIAQSAAALGGNCRRAKVSVGAEMARRGFAEACCVGMMLFALFGLQRCSGYEFKVGGLDAWALPTAAKPDLYQHWSAENKFKVGDSLLFLYPPSQDSVIQVTEEAYNKCNLSSPVASFDDGNTVFKFVRPGRFYFTSGAPGHCEKAQKLAVVVMSANGAVASGPASGLLSVVGSPALSPNAMVATGGAPTGRSVTTAPCSMATLALGLFMGFF